MYTAVLQWVDQQQTLTRVLQQCKHVLAFIWVVLCIAGCVVPGKLTVSLGTSGTLFGYSGTPIFDSTG